MPDIEKYQDPVVVLDANNVLTTQNEAARRRFGDDIHAISGWLTVAAASQGAPLFRHDDIEYQALEITRDQNTRCVLLYSFDAHDAHELDAASTSCHAQFLKMTENLASVAFWDYDADTQKFNWSHGVYEIYGEKQAQYSPTIHNYFDFFIGDDKKLAQSFFARALSDLLPFEFTLRIERKDNSIHWIRSRAIVETDEHNKAKTIYGVTQDLTEELRNKEQLERLSLVASRTANAVMICDKTGAIEWVNVGFEKLTGYFSQEVVNKKPEEFLYGALTDKNIQDTIRLSARDKIPINCDLIYYNKVGDHYWVNLVFTPIVQQNELEGFIGIFTNISDRKKTDNYVAQAQRMEAIGQLVGGVAHDFNNILGILRGNLELLELKLQQQDNKHLDKAIHACDRASGLTKKLLQFSRFKVTESRQINPNQIIVNFADLLTKSLTQNVKLELQLEPKVYHVWSSSGDLEDAILNLVINARDAMEGNGKVIISTENVTLGKELRFYSHNASVMPGDYVRLSIKDTGPGIPEDLQARIFEPFFTTKEQGSGLGLSMVYGFVQRSNGYILVDSGRDFGTEISIWLPRSESEKPQIAAIISPVESKIDRPFKIFVVDDEIDILEIVGEYLSPLGCEVITTSNPVEAQRILLEDKEIDLLLTDEIMPGVVKGHTLVKTALHSNKKIRCIIMSGYNLDLGQIVGKADVLTKPFTRSELIKMINKNLKVIESKPTS